MLVADDYLPDVLRDLQHVAVELLGGEDIQVLLGVLDRLVEAGNTVIIIEHNLDVLKSVDYLLDMGPEGGRRGGRIVAAGTPEELAVNPDSVTGPFLKEVL